MSTIATTGEGTARTTATRRTARVPRGERPSLAARILRPVGVVGVVALVVFFVGPILWVLWGSVRSGNRFTGINYGRLLEYGAGLGTYVANTGLVVAITVVGSLAVSVLAGYAFARLQFPGKNLLFVGVLAI